MINRRVRRGRREREEREDSVNIEVSAGFVGIFLAKNPPLADIVMLNAPTVAICNCKTFPYLLAPLLEFFALLF